MVETNFPQATLLLIDDEATNLLLLQRILERAGYRQLKAFTDPREALARFGELAPDLIITDLHMPQLSGLELIAQLRRHLSPDSYLPIVMLTADHHPDSEEAALAAGASDFIHKPFRAAQIALRVHNLLHTRFLHLALKEHNSLLEARVRERTIELEQARTDALERLALAAEYRDHSTGQHTLRVGALAAALADELGLDAHTVELIRRAAPLHDVGKIGIPDTILLKPAQLNAQEYAMMQQHVDLGARLLASGSSKLVQLAQLIALTHHERWDGSGYPRGLKGEEIPLVGQIVAVADVFDTLTHERPYKPAWPIAEAVAEVMRLSGSWFAPRVVDAFVRVIARQHPEALASLASPTAPPDRNPET